VPPTPLTGVGECCLFREEARHHAGARPLRQWKALFCDGHHSLPRDDGI